jgi:hypothetical protein
MKIPFNICLCLSPTGLPRVLWHSTLTGDDTGQINFDFAQVDENIAKRLSDEDLRDIFAIHRSREEPQKSKAYELF